MIEINTKTLQNMVNKAVKGASNNKLLPLTSYMKISATDGKLTLLTTDGMNYLEVCTENVVDTFSAVVLADMFAKLVNRLSGDTVKLDVTDKYLIVECNGTYKLELLLDEDSNPVDFNMPQFELDESNTISQIDRGTVSRIIGSLKQSLAVATVRPHYCCYRVGDEIVATDTVVISILNKKVFDTAHLISAECMNLLDTVVDEGKVASVYQLDGALVFTTDTATLYTREPNGIENFNVSAIKGYANADFPSKCTVSTKALINALDRIALFVGEYDAGAVTLKFDEDGITISSKNISGVESVAYETVELTDTYECVCDVMSALTLLKAQQSDVFTLYFGGEQTVKFVDGDLVTILALMS